MTVADGDLGFTPNQLCVAFIVDVMQIGCSFDEKWGNVDLHLQHQSKSHWCDVSVINDSDINTTVDTL